jgi:hypothetical protein
MKTKALILLFGVTLLSACSSYPTDRAMESKLSTHRAEFDELVSMFKVDEDLRSVNREVAPGQNPNQSLPDERIAEYRRLLTELDLIAVERSRSGDIYLKVWETEPSYFMGSLVYSAKSYVYIQSQSGQIGDLVSPSKKLVDSLDQAARSSDSVYAFKKVTDDWYLHYEEEK